MPEQHARIGPSSFARVKACPASLNFAAQFPNETNDAAEEGTACHEVVERMLDGELIEPGWVSSNGITITVEHLAHCDECFDFIAGEGFDRIMTEIRVPVGRALRLNDPNIAWGTSDVIGIAGSAVRVVDFKFGFVPVEAVTIAPDGSRRLNAQGMCYLIGALEALADRFPGQDFDEFEIVIVQPRAGGVKRATVSWAEIHAFKEEAREAIMLALSGGAPLFNPGEDQCRFCPASGSCKAQVLDEFDDLDHVDPDALSDEDLAGWLDKADHIVATVKAMQSAALQRLAAGRKVPGWVREQGNGRARWRDEAEVIEEIEAAGLDLDLYAPRKPTTQTALKAASALGAKVVETLIVRPPGEVKLVRAEDAKNPLDAEFEALD
jgi:hypothetical protein